MRHSIDCYFFGMVENKSPATKPDIELRQKLHQIHRIICCNFGIANYCKYASLLSIPMKRLPRFKAATPVLPLPQKGSSTIAFCILLAKIIRSSKATAIQRRGIVQRLSGVSSRNGN